MPRPPAVGTIDVMKRSDIDDTVREMWQTRPHRRRDDRKIAGVAAAIGRRYGIDPILVRIALVVATVYGGIGILVYLLGWLLLPEEGDEVSAAEALIGHGRSSMSKPLTVVLAIALIPASSGIFTGSLSALFALAVVSGAVYLLHRHRGGTPVPTAQYAAMATPVDTPAAAGRVQDTPPHQAGRVQDAPPHQQTPPAWDPLGVAPFAWDLPEPSPAGPPPAPPVKRRRSAVTPVTLALALMVGGVAAIVAMSSDVFGPLEVAGLTLGVIGLGLVAGSFVRGGRGLIAVAIPLALVTYALSVVPFDRFDPRYGVGDEMWVPKTVGELNEPFRHSVGHAVLDLRQLDLTDSNQRIEVDVELGVGDLDVLLPPDVDVEASCNVGVGAIKCLGDEDQGPQASASATDFGDDDEEGGARIVLNASIGAAGDLEVTRRG